MAKETKQLTGRVGRYDPLDVKGYEALGGWKGLRRALGMKPQEVIEEVHRSGLTGRGGAGFPTGVKWRSAVRVQDGPRYLICNADEGEFGTFKDKVLLDGDPWLVLEGILIAAYAIGAGEAYIYLKGEYGETVTVWEKLATEVQRGAVMGLSAPPRLRVARGRGLYIAGEELALIASLEMRRPTSGIKPPYPTERGFLGKPTVVNNVETLANIPVILAEGADAYRSLGVEDDPGTRLFSLSGDVNRPGVYELELGSATLNELIHDLGGGARDAVTIKAVQPGGGSSALLRSDALGCSLTTASIRQAGSSIGTGAVIVYGEDISAVSILEKLLAFYAEESCGRCAPCRIGVRKMAEIVANLASGRGTPEDLDLLRRTAMTCVSASTCGMGQSFPLPVLSALDLFPEDFQSVLGSHSSVR